MNQNPWCEQSGKSLEVQTAFEDNFLPTKAEKLPDSEEYLKRLERELTKLKSKSSVLKQLAERRQTCMENLLRGSIDIDNESDFDFNENRTSDLIRRHIIPEQPINSVELLQLIKHDQLEPPSPDESNETEPENQ